MMRPSWLADSDPGSMSKKTRRRNVARTRKGRFIKIVG
jgi:hypothetical protein